MESEKRDTTRVTPPGIGRRDFFCAELVTEPKRLRVSALTNHQEVGPAVPKFVRTRMKTGWAASAANDRE